MSNAQNTNKKAGRPVGSRSKNTLNNAIKRFEALQIDAANVIINIMMGNEAYFDNREIKVAERMSAAKYVITAPAQMRKDNESPRDGESSEEEVTEATVVVPLVSMRN